jgi:alginate O-acetyltransferase complex protein AlgI
MVFSSPIFLFAFLPLVLLCLAVPSLKARNSLLLVFSLVFYAWGEVVFAFLMLGSTVVNYYLGLWVEQEKEQSRRRWAVAVAVALNIGTLAFFKYANFVVANCNELLQGAGLQPMKFEPVRLPIGISFFTFHALSYVIDVYRGKWRAARNPVDVALYIFFFPQLIAGPILRWSAMAPQIARRVVTRAGFAEGVRRFSEGLAKKMVVANVVAAPADQIFALPKQELGPVLAWFGTLCYTIQIYFDFSGYSDMAVGLGRMFGFEFIENFNFPYISQSIREFWRRWHISLSSWFRDYLYLPLGGNRVSDGRTYLNLLIVFFLCGLWHGASWTFVVWGLYHGVFLVIERTRFGQIEERLWRPLRHLYVPLVGMGGWVLVRAETFSQAAFFLQNMLGFKSAGEATQPLGRYVSAQVVWALILGIIFSTPLWPRVREWAQALAQAAQGRAQIAAQATGLVLETVVLVALLLVSAAWLAGGTYNPFIYFRF